MDILIIKEKTKIHKSTDNLLRSAGNLRARIEHSNNKKLNKSELIEYLQSVVCETELEIKEIYIYIKETDLTHGLLFDLIKCEHSKLVLLFYEMWEQLEDLGGERNEELEEFYYDTRYKLKKKPIPYFRNPIADEMIKILKSLEL